MSEMKVTCRRCGKIFYLPERTVRSIAAGYIRLDSVNICDECNYPGEYGDDIENIFSNADESL